ncbi:matrixin family metalloprotease [Sphingomonas sp. M1-B02]|uniref:matrixin family metalloprotease n=1 Tax=Sphingomonas sp. M1-B02 TaxID=3114300 RepID=UPI0022402BBB|nr:matrixin family metalloprotease [Sphingomonas sp. S6-11]UZK66579.1 M10 family metallopeptidase C-terminal domain-containing protein [Sphingomonas sp. S6-11]
MTGSVATYMPVPDQLRAIARSAFSTVSAVTNVTFVEAPASSGYRDVDIVINGTTISGGGAAFFPTRQGYALFPSTGDIYLGANTVQQNGGISKSTYDVVGNGSLAGFYETFLHELGHALGLFHPMNYSDATGAYNPNTSRNQSRDAEHALYGDGLRQRSRGQRCTVGQAPMPLDILALQKLYGINQTASAGDDTCTIPALNPGLRTIWDFGGTDTLDLSNMKVAARLDLRIGGVSDIGKI